MALRAFHCNPSLGGFGGESGAYQTNLLLPPDGRAKNDFGKTNPKESIQNVGDGNNPKESSSSTSSDCDAFAQIVKELVDNAVDACSHDQQPPPVLKRVRVVIEPVTDGDGNKENEDCNLVTRNEELLRVTVTDNGCGMEDIESCVAAFKTSKSTGGSAGVSDKNKKNGSKAKGKKQSKKNKKEKNDEEDDKTLQQKKENQTAASSTHWTRASYVVDTDDDAVRCVKKELLPKLGDKNESGTAVGLLVPGGRSAQSAWPRLAEYFARFQLSLGLQCSIQVMASTLSSVPLFVRPPIEMERRVAIIKENKEQIGDNSNERMDDETSREGEESSKSSVSKGEDEWNDGMLDDDENDKEWQHPSKSKNGNNSQELKGREDTNSNGVSDIDWDDFFNDKRADGDDKSNANRSSYDNKIGKRKEYPQCKDRGNHTKEASTSRAKKKQEQIDDHRLSILRACSSYLNRPVELKNVAHSIQPIRRRNDNDNSNNLNNEKKSEPDIKRPMLEVDMIVYGPDEDDNDIGENEEENAGDGLQSTYGNFDRDRITNLPLPESDGNSAKLILIRMVNRIPLLDGAEASSCGLVHGLTSKHSTWNSFGLDVSLLTDFGCSTNNNEKAVDALTADDDCNERKTLPNYQPSKGLYIPSFTVRDSIQVAPFFQSHTHSLFEPDDDNSDGEGNNSISDNGSDDDIESNITRKRKRKRKRLLPANLRLGNILVLAQIHAEPSALPLPTLSKGRLPMNDRDIDNALEVGLASCLRSLQRTNPDLLLTTQQLRKTERDVKHVPAVAAALSSIICRSHNKEFQENASEMIVNWVNQKPELHKNTQTRQTRPSEVFPQLVPSDFPPTGKPTYVDVPNSQSFDECSSVSASLNVVGERLNESRSMLRVDKLGPLIEERLRFVLSGRNQRRKLRQKKEEEEEERKKLEEDLRTKKEKRKRLHTSGEESTEDSRENGNGCRNVDNLEEFLRNSSAGASKSLGDRGMKASATHEVERGEISSLPSNQRTPDDEYSFDSKGYCIDGTSAFSPQKSALALPLTDQKKIDRLEDNEGDFDADEWWDEDAGSKRGSCKAGNV